MEKVKNKKRLKSLVSEDILEENIGLKMRCFKKEGHEITL